MLMIINNIICNENKIYSKKNIFKYEQYFLISK